MLDVSDPPATRSVHRITEVDILRGFALFGILICNAVVAVLQWAPDRARSGSDHLVLATVEALVSGRFYPLFAFLFGYAFTLQITAAHRAGASPTARWARRCAALMLVGLVHVFLLWDGDILSLYAALGLILIAVRALSSRMAALAGAMLSLTWATSSFLPGIGLSMPEVGAAYTGTAAETFAAQVAVAPTAVLLVWSAGAVPSLAMCLLGMAAGKLNLFEQSNAVRTWALRVVAVGLCAGLPVSALTFAGTMQWWTPPACLAGIQALVNPLMTFAYIAAVVSAARSVRVGRYCSVFAPAGKMAASNYIGQSIVLMLVYTGYGLALADDLSLSAVVAVGLLTFAAQLGLSAWWLRRHPYGPVEWVLRAATYWSVPAWRR